MIVNLYEAKSQLSRLVERAAADEDIIIGKAGRPMARLVADVEDKQPRRPGLLEGKVWLADDFDETPSWPLDTHAVLWWLADAPMDAAATARIVDPDSLVAVSAASVWEMAIKRALGKLRTDGSVIDAIGRSGFEPLPVSLEHAERAGGLPAHHRDPFDRMLIAKAQAEGLTLVTRDPVFDDYEVDVLRC